MYPPAEWADTLTLFYLYQYMYSVLSTITADSACAVISHLACAWTEASLTVKYITLDELPTRKSIQTLLNCACAVISHLACAWTEASLKLS